MEEILVHILNDNVFENLNEKPLETGRYCEQIGMFDALGLRSSVYDALIWEADFDNQAIRLFDNSGRNVMSFPINELEMRVTPDSIEKMRKYYDALGVGIRQIVDETIEVNLSGSWENWHVKGVLDRPRGHVYATGVAVNMDATAQQRKRLDYLEKHDPLTGLLNISSFDAQFEYLSRFGMYPLSLVVFRIEKLCDACGTLGYQAGNTLICNVADVIRDCFFDADIIGRTGGGEYCCAFTGKDLLEIETRIDEAMMRLHSTYVNLIKTEISSGYAIAEFETDFSGLYHEAYQKLIKGKNIRSYLSQNSVVDNLNAIISKKTGWGKRVVRLQSMSVQIGKALFCAEETLSDIKMLAKIADIGLIGVDDNLLARRLQLSKDEKDAYDAHIEVGREIISSIDSLAHMEGLYSDLFKRYDEWKDAIAMPSRIVAAVTCFDDLLLADSRMTYKELMQKMTSRNGTIYCPEIVDVLLEVARKHNWPVHSRRN